MSTSSMMSSPASSSSSSSTASSSNNSISVVGPNGTTRSLLLRRRGTAGTVPIASSATTTSSSSPSSGLTAAGKLHSEDAGKSVVMHVDVDRIISVLLQQGRSWSPAISHSSSSSSSTSSAIDVTESEIRAVCLAARALFLRQPPLLDLAPPLKIAGDIHGQFSDLLRMFQMTGFPPAANFLFLGDYVDRGPKSIETILLLLCYKIKYPENFFLLRGNHEVANLNRIYGFYDECKRRYSVKLWKVFQDVFNCMPIAALIDGKIFCCHGGLSPQLRSLDQLRRIARPVDVSESGLLCDLLWSDPDASVVGWAPSERGVSYVFGVDVLNHFLRTLDLDIVVRGHQVVEDGYEFFGRRGLVTVFTAPNYCGEFDNAGAVMNVDEHLLCSFQILKPIPTVLKEKNYLTTSASSSSSALSSLVHSAKLLGSELSGGVAVKSARMFRRGVI